MRLNLILLILFLSSSCVTLKEIKIHSDGSANVTQQYSLVNPRELQDSKGYFDKQQERREYNSSLISDFDDIYDSDFSFKIQNVDSLGNYLSGLPKGFVQIRMLGDTLCIIETQKLENKPAKQGGIIDHYLDLNFETDVLNIAQSQKSRVWHKKNNIRQVGLNIYPKKLWKKQRTHLIVIELKQDAP